MSSQFSLSTVSAGELKEERPVDVQSDVSTSTSVLSTFSLLRSPPSLDTSFESNVSDKMANDINEFFHSVSGHTSPLHDSIPET